MKTGIYLEKDEKILLRHLVRGSNGRKPAMLTSSQYYIAAYGLKTKGLVSFDETEDDPFFGMRPTDFALNYMDINPALRNPVNWKDWVVVICAVITALSTFVALFTACKVLTN